MSTLGFCVHFFMVPERYGSFRLAIDLKCLDGYIVIPSFKMKTALSIQAALQPGEWEAKLDLKDATYHITVHPYSQIFPFQSVTGDKRPILCPTPWTVNDSPRVFTKILAPLMHYPRTQDIRVQAYLDDRLLRADSRQQCQRYLDNTLELLQYLWCTINCEKSVQSPHRLSLLELVSG